MVAFILKRLFQALDLLHNECCIAHTDIKEANILLGADDSVIQDFECEQLRNPCPRKVLPERTIYQSRQLNMPRAVGEPVSCGFGSSVPLDDGVEHQEDTQPDVYRAPEIILDIPWSYSVDIWNARCCLKRSATALTGSSSKTGSRSLATENRTIATNGVIQTPAPMHVPHKQLVPRNVLPTDQPWTHLPPESQVSRACDRLCNYNLAVISSPVTHAAVTHCSMDGPATR